MTQSIVLLFGSSNSSGHVSALTGEKSKLEAILSSAPGPVEVNMVTLGLTRSIQGIGTHIDLGGQDPGLTDRVLTALGAYALRRKLATFPIGRLLNSLGPVDQGRLFWRAVRRNRQALALIRRSDIAIAADMPAVKTAWLSARRHLVDQAYYDHRAASVGVTFQLPAAE